MQKNTLTLLALLAIPRPVWAEEETSEETSEETTDAPAEAESPPTDETPVQGNLTPVVAAEVSAHPKHGVGLGVSMMGGDLNYIYSHTRQLQFVASFGGMRMDKVHWTEEFSGKEFDTSGRFLFGGVTAHYRPVEQLDWMRVAGGIKVNKIGFEYSTDLQAITGDTRYCTPVSLYGGIGAGMEPRAGLGFALDLGLHYIGPPSFRLQGNGTKQVAADVDAKYNAFFPGMRLGLNFIF